MDQRERDRSLPRTDTTTLIDASTHSEKRLAVCPAGSTNLSQLWRSGYCLYGYVGGVPSRRHPFRVNGLVAIRVRRLRPAAGGRRRSER
jgi:hypothetical protein